jgi:hypothetical protein
MGDGNERISCYTYFVWFKRFIRDASTCRPWQFQKIRIVADRLLETTQARPTGGTVSLCSTRFQPKRFLLNTAKTAAGRNAFCCASEIGCRGLLSCPDKPMCPDPNTNMQKYKKTSLLPNHLHFILITKPRKLFNKLWQLHRRRSAVPSAKV